MNCNQEKAVTRSVNKHTWRTFGDKSFGLPVRRLGEAEELGELLRLTPERTSPEAMPESTSDSEITSIIWWTVCSTGARLWLPVPRVYTFKNGDTRAAKYGEQARVGAFHEKQGQEKKEAEEKFQSREKQQV